MKKHLLLLGLSLLAGLAAAQTDHDNIDAGRPLRFEDAEPVPFRSMALEFGLGLRFPRGSYPGFSGHFAFIYGAALNGQFEIGFEPVFGGRAGTDDTFGAIEAYEIGYLHSFRQEIGESPALALKAEASFPGLAGEDPTYRIRGIATKSLGDYDRIHFNVDVEFQPGASGGEKSSRLGAVLGFTRPIGYPREFNTTALAEVALLPGEHRGKGYTVSLGLGVRRQITPRAVLDFGIQSDVAPGKGMNPTPLRLIAGYSISL